MVCIIEIIKKLQQELLCHINVDHALYNYCRNSKIIDFPFGNNTALKIAMRGFNGEVEKNFNVDIIDSHQKQNNFKDKFSQCVGIRLFTQANYSILLEDFQRFDLKRKYIMSIIFPQLLPELKKCLILDTSIVSKFINLILEKEEDISRVQEIEYNYILEDNSDIVDLIILEDYLKKYGLSNYRTHDSKEFILEILNRFSNSIKWITKNRNKNKPQFEIKDEYDVQDVLCLILQSIFPDCEKEDPMQKDPQGLSHRIDLVIHSLGIYIEVKMIKDNNKNDLKMFKKQIDEDIVGYSISKDLKHLIFFTYDPNGYADNEEYFRCKTCSATNNNITYTIDKVYQK